MPCLVLSCVSLVFALHCFHTCHSFTIHHHPDAHSLNHSITLSLLLFFLPFPFSIIHSLPFPTNLFSYVWSSNSVIIQEHTPRHSFSFLFPSLLIEPPDSLTTTHDIFPSFAFCSFVTFILSSLVLSFLSLLLTHSASACLGTLSIYHPSSFILIFISCYFLFLLPFPPIHSLANVPGHIFLCNLI